MKHQRIIFVPGTEVDEDIISTSAVLDWGWQHLDHPNVMQVTEDELYLLDRQTQVLEIISGENGNCMIGFDEDAAVYDTDVKRNIHQRIKAYQTSLFPGNRFETPLDVERAQRLTRQLLYLLEVSIATGKSIQFLF